MGLLFDLAQTFADQKLDVHLAKVGTYGPRVVDAFYLTDRNGEKLDAGAAASLESVLRATASAWRRLLNQ